MSAVRASLRRPYRALRRLLGLHEPRWRRVLRSLHRRRGSLTFVQIGAFDGVRFDDLHDFVTSLPGCSGLVVEPLPDAFELLCAAYAAYPAIRPVRTALHPTSRRVTLHRVAPERLAGLPDWSAGIASLDPRHHLRSGTPSDAIVRVEVDACTLGELLSRNGVEQLDLLQVDTEGFDAEVVRMLDLDRFRPAVIRYEHVNLTASERKRTGARLREHGYEIGEDGVDDTVAIRR